MANSSGRKSPGGASGGDELPWIVGIVAAALVAPQVLGRARGKLDELLGSEAAARAAEVLPNIVAGLVVVAVLLVVRTVVARVRRRRWAALAASVADALPKTWDANSGLIVRWAPFAWRVNRVIVNYPAEADDRDAIWRASVVDLVTYRAGMEESTSEWAPQKLRATIKRKKPVVAPASTQANVNRAEQKARVHQLIGGMFDSSVTVNIVEWTKEDDNAPEGGNPSRIELNYPPTTRDASDSWRQRLETIVALKVPPGDARWTGEYKTAEDRLILRRRPALPEKVMHPGISAWTGKREGISIPYGVDENGRVTAWALTGKASKMHPTVHTLVIGPTGTGKTSVMRSLVVGATCQGVYVLNADPKRIELTPFRGWPGVLAVASTAEDIALTIKAVHDFMEYRYQLLEPPNSVDTDDMSPVLLFLDELLILKSMLRRWWGQHKGDPGVAETWGTKTGSDHPAMSLLTNILAMSRSANIRVVLGTQRPDASLFEEGGRDNVRHRISMGRLSQEGAQMLWGNPYTGTDTPMIAGRAVTSPDGAVPVDTQMYWTPDPRATAGADGRLMTDLRAAAQAAFAQVDSPAGLDLSELSDMALSTATPAQPLDEEWKGAAPCEPPAELVEHGALTTQTVFADALVEKDRVLVDGELWTVSVPPEQVQNPDDPDLYDHLAITFEGATGSRLEEAPADAQYERVVEVFENEAQTAEIK